MKISEPKLKKVLDALDLREAAELVKGKYKGGGRPPYPPIPMLKALLFEYLKELPSDNQLVKWLRRQEHQHWARWLGFRKRVPDQSTFSNFKKRLGVELFEEIFSLLVKQCRDLGIIKGHDISIDSTDQKAYCNPRKRMSDSDARIGHSTTKKWIFGYKAHIAVDTDSELPIAVKTFPANVHDKKGFFPVFGIVLQNFAIRIRNVICDCAYHATEILNFLRKHNWNPVIAVNGRGRYRSELPKDEEIYNKRSASERVNSRLKECLRLDDLKVRGLQKVAIHNILCCMAQIALAIGATIAKLGNYREIRSFQF